MQEPLAQAKSQGALLLLLGELDRLAFLEPCPLMLGTCLKEMKERKKCENMLNVVTKNVAIKEKQQGQQLTVIRHAHRAVYIGHGKEEKNIIVLGYLITKEDEEGILKIKK